MDEYVTQNDVDQYELLLPLLQASYHEIETLSKKKPDSPLNAYKVKVINRILDPIKELLKSEPSFVFLDTLNTDELPTNSDVVLLLSQYQKSMNIYHTEHYSNSTYQWKIKKQK